MNILLTGGAGYIGSHTAVVLSEAGHEVILLDNFCNSDVTVLERLEKILGKSVPCIDIDVRNTEAIKKILVQYHIDAIVHFAGLKSVGDSAKYPLDYYANNVQGTISLLEAMQSKGIKNLIFSSSATVYGEPKYLPADEDHPISVTNPYGRSKLNIEEMLKDVSRADNTLKIISLRYFNPVGAHDSGLLGENPSSPNNLAPYIAHVASANLPFLNIFGDDYPTIDGTGVRDYVHVMDLAEGHLAAINHLKSSNGWEVFNLGSGSGYSVLELLHAFEKVSLKKISYKVVARRPGDVPEIYADISKAKKILKWSPKRNVLDMCSSFWRYWCG